MNEELKQALLNIINGATAFVGEQAPAVVQELLTWHLAYNAIWLPISLGVMWFIAKMARKIWKGANDKESDSWMRDCCEPSPPAIIVVCVLWVVSFFSGLNAIVNAETVIQISLAPKVYLIEYAADLAKGD